MNYRKSICLCVGHYRNRPGAEDPETGLTEWQVNTYLVKAVAGLLQAEQWQVTVLEDSSLTRKVKTINALNVSIALDFHLNASSRLAAGHEVLYWHQSELGQVLSESITRNITLNKDRGAIPVEHESGSYFCRTVTPVAAVIETAFIDNLVDFTGFMIRINEYAVQIVTGIRSYVFTVTMYADRFPLLSTVPGTGAGTPV